MILGWKKKTRSDKCITSVLRVESKAFTSCLFGGMCTSWRRGDEIQDRPTVTVNSVVWSYHFMIHDQQNVCKILTISKKVPQKSSLFQSRSTPWKINGWNLRMHPWKRIIIFQTIMTSGSMLVFWGVHVYELSQKKSRTPLGDLPLNLDTLAELRKTQEFSFLPMDVDEARVDHTQMRNQMYGNLDIRI